MAFLLIAVVGSVVGITIVLLRNRRPNSMEHSIDEFERNLRALLAAWLDRLDLVLREDFEVQKKLLERAQAKLADLERRTTELDSRGQSQRPR